MAISVTKIKYMNLIFRQKPKLQSTSLNSINEGMKENSHLDAETNMTKEVPAHCWELK